jgi:hypothetical protein
VRPATPATYGGARGETLAFPLVTPTRREDDVPMLNHAPLPAADAVALHRAQRRLVAASLLACPPRAPKPASPRWP